MAKEYTFSLGAGFQSFLCGRIVLHKSILELRRHFAELEKEESNTVEAFVHFDSGPPKEGEPVFTMHFARRFLTYEVVAHECFHAGLVAIRRAGLNIDHDYVEELGAEVAALAMNHTLLFLRRIKDVKIV